MGRFGDTLKISIKVSGLKYATISQRINFDPSYISKWIHSDLLPSSKISATICEEISKLLVEQLDLKDLNSLCRELNLEPSRELEDIYYNLNTKIYEDYLFDCSERNQKDKSITNTITTSNTSSSTENRTTILDKIIEYRKISNSINISIIGELLCCSPEDIIFLMDIRSEIIRLDFKSVKFNVFISDPSIANCSKELTGVTLINLFMIPCKWKISYYTINVLSSGIIINIDNLLNYTSQLFYNNSWMLSNCNNNIDYINNFSKTIHRDLMPIARKLFDTYDNTSPQYMESMVKVFSLRQNCALVGTLDTFFLSTDLLNRILEFHKDIPNELKSYWLKKHKINQDRIQLGEDIKYIVYRDAFERLVYKGCIRLFDREIYLPIELRLEVLKSINDKLDTFNNIKLKIIDSYLVDEIKHEPLPNVYISTSNAYFITSPVNNFVDYCYIKNKKYISSLNKTFTNLWREYSLSLLSGDIVIEEYLNICQEILFFELI